MNNVIAWFDAAVAAGKEDGRTLADSLDAVCQRVEADPAGAGVPDEAQLRQAWVEKTVRAERDTRARKRKETFLWVRDCLADETIRGTEDPILDQAMRTGLSSGLDKTLRFWSTQDWLDVLGASAQNVAAAVEADKELREIVNPIILGYGSQGIRVMGDLW